MAHEAFALSPISARAASPTDADFEAIREAFLETARGRWFLDEYAKRNRNADTTMVLDAVARIERTLAAQKEEQKPQPSTELPNAMAAVKAIVAAARDSAMAALAGPVIEDALAPSRKCARVIREIVWGLRESGADGRICALLDSQVEAINAACDHVAAGGLRDGVLEAFDQAAQQIDGITPHAVVQPQKPVTENHSVTLTLVPTEPAQHIPAAAADDTSFEVASAAEISSSEIMTEAETLAEPVLLTEEALLAEPVGTFADPVEMESVRTVHLTIVPDAQAEPTQEIAPEPEPVIEMRAPAAPTSLGASLIASGIVAKSMPRIDLLAPIRRMSQAEKIAFFS